MSSIQSLQNILASTSRRELSVTEEPRELRKLVRALRTEVNHFDPSPSPDRRIAAIAAYMRNGAIDDPKQLRTLCFSVMEVFPSVGKRLLGFPEPFRKLLDAVSAQPSLWFRKCYQGLMNSYFGDSGTSDLRSPDEREGFINLRDFLASGIGRLRSLRRVPLWATTLESRPHLLDDEPCNVFGSDIADGNMEPFERLRTDLDVAGTSWLLQAAAIAGIKTGCTRGDGAFRACLHNLLELIQRFPLVAHEGLANLLNRYACIPGAPESRELLQNAITLWGNPLHRRNLPTWDRAGEAATRMCSTWLKSSLIEDFFEHLSADGSADRRRVNFWKQYVPHIDDMYFALGRSARNDRSQDTKRLRNTMGDRLLRLEGPVPKNNAFLMQMGDFIVVEFGLSSNAAFIFKRDNLPFALESEIRDERKSLWQAYARDRLLHIDGNGAWENDFATSIRRHLNIADPRRKSATSANSSSDPVSRTSTPTAAIQKPSAIDNTSPDSEQIRVHRNDTDVIFSPENLADCCLLYGVPFKQWSPNVFEVSATDRNPGLNAILEQWGFRYNPRKWNWTFVRNRS